MKEIENDEERREQFTKIVYTLQKLTQSIFNLPTTTELLEVFGKMVINSFTICDGEMQSIGVGVYLGGSNLDHSCNPNAAITFTGKTLQLRTLEPVRDLLPSELRISYIDLMSVTSDRKKQLQQQYYFDCDCSRCSDRELDGFMMCVKCQNDLCQDGFLPQSPDGTYLACCSCAWHSSDSTFLSNVLQYQKDLSEMIHKLRETDNKLDKTDILQHCRTFLEAYLSYVHIYNISCVRIEDKAFDLSIDLELWEEALQHGQKTLTAYRKYYPAYSPNLGIQLMKVGKIQFYLGQLQDSYQTFTQAENILSVSHGEKHYICGQLKELMNQNCEELRLQ